MCNSALPCGILCCQPGLIIRPCWPFMSVSSVASFGRKTVRPVKLRKIRSRPGLQLMAKARGRSRKKRSDARQKRERYKACACVRGTQFSSTPRDAGYASSPPPQAFRTPVPASAEPTRLHGVSPFILTGSGASRWLTSWAPLGFWSPGWSISFPCRRAWSSRTSRPDRLRLRGCRQAILLTLLQLHARAACVHL